VASIGSGTNRLSQIRHIFPLLRRGRVATAVRELLDPLASAKNYVATDEVSGELQFELLKREGCVPGSRVLEVGCGCLNAGVPLLRYLEPGHYVGIDPNEWLPEKAMEQEGVRRLVQDKQARFLSVDDFDASSLGLTFDYVLSHSVLSHCAHWQLDQLIGNVARVLAPSGRIVASIRLAEGNAYGSPGAPDRDDSRDEQWVYPGTSWFRFATVSEAAGRHRLAAASETGVHRFLHPHAPGRIS
jgi:SAM-dependent methyltransferase